MIDLNRKPEKPKKEEEDPLGLVILVMMPFVWAFWMLIERGL